MSDYGWLSQCQLPQKSGKKKITGVSDASMIELRAVLAETSYSKSTACRSNSAESAAAVNNDDRKRQRIEKDDAIYKEERKRRSIKNVAQSLKKKAELYDKLSSGEAVESERDQYLVDFSRKKSLSDLNSGHTDLYHRNDDDCFVQIEDEFGRSKYVKEKSSEYRCYIAEKARRLRQEEMRNTPGFSMNVSNSGFKDTIASKVIHKAYNGNIPYEKDTIRNDFRPMNDVAKDAVKQFHTQVTSQRSEHVELITSTRKMTAKEKKAARIELIRQKQAEQNISK